MKEAHRHLSAGALALLLLASILLLLWYDHATVPARQELVAMREVKIYSPPPPAPPPVTREDATRPSAPDLSAINVLVPVELDSMALNVSLQPGEFSGSNAFNGDIGIGFGVVDLESLDSYPALTNTPVYVYSAQSLRDNLRSIQAELHIAIDEQGNARLVRVLSTNYPEDQRHLADFVSRARFTPPTLLGVPVRTEYIWPIRVDRE